MFYPSMSFPTSPIPRSIIQTISIRQSINLYIIVLHQPFQSCVITQPNKLNPHQLVFYLTSIWAKCQADPSPLSSCQTRHFMSWPRDSMLLNVKVSDEPRSNGELLVSESCIKEKINYKSIINLYHHLFSICVVSHNHWWWSHIELTPWISKERTRQMF